jgi:hypothetical protein
MRARRAAARQHSGAAAGRRTLSESAVRVSVTGGGTRLSGQDYTTALSVQGPNGSQATSGWAPSAARSRARWQPRTSAQCGSSRSRPTSRRSASTTRRQGPLLSARRALTPACLLLGQVAAIVNTAHHAAVYVMDGANRWVSAQQRYAPLQLVPVRSAPTLAPLAAKSGY